MEQKNQPHTNQERGFVVEDRNGGQPVYYDARTAGAQGGSFAWVPEKEKALQFHRRIDAERFITKHLAWAVGQVTVVPL